MLWWFFLKLYKNLHVCFNQPVVPFRGKYLWILTLKHYCPWAVLSCCERSKDWLLSDGQDWALYWGTKPGRQPNLEGGGDGGNQKNQEDSYGNGSRVKAGLSAQVILDLPPKLNPICSSVCVRVSLNQCWPLATAWTIPAIFLASFGSTLPMSSS